MMQTLIYPVITEKLKMEWEDLWRSSSCSHYFNSYNWFETLIELFNYESLKIVTVYKDGRLEALIPLIKDTVFGVPMYQSPGGKYIDRSGLLLKSHDKKITKTLIKALIKLGDFYLPEIPEELMFLFPKLNGSQIYISSTNYYLPFDDDPYRFVSKKNLKRVSKKMNENKNNLKFKRYRGSSKALKEAMELDRKSMREKRGRGTFTNDDNRRFFEVLLKINGKNVLIHTISFNGTPFIYDIGILSGTTYHALNTSFIPDFKFLVPGKMLTYSIVKSLDKIGVRCLDFNRGEGELKKEMTQLKKYQYDYVFFSSSIKRMRLNAVRNGYDLILKTPVLYSFYCRIRKNSRQLGIL